MFRGIDFSVGFCGIEDTILASGRRKFDQACEMEQREVGTIVYIV